MNGLLLQLQSNSPGQVLTSSARQADELARVIQLRAPELTAVVVGVSVCVTRSDRCSNR